MFSGDGDWQGTSLQFPSVLLHLKGTIIFFFFSLKVWGVLSFLFFPSFFITEGRLYLYVFLSALVMLVDTIFMLSPLPHSKVLVSPREHLHMTSVLGFTSGGLVFVVAAQGMSLDCLAPVARGACIPRYHRTVAIRESSCRLPSLGHCTEGRLKHSPSLSVRED